MLDKSRNYESCEIKDLGYLILYFITLRLMLAKSD